MADPVKPATPTTIPPKAARLPEAPAAKSTDPAVEKADVKLRVATARGIPHRNRAGERFTQTPRDIAVTPSQAKLIEEDTGLVVYRIGAGGDFGDELSVSARSENMSLRQENAQLRSENERLVTENASLRGQLNAIEASPSKGR